jgi:hypothetical protein
LATARRNQKPLHQLTIAGSGGGSSSVLSATVQAGGVAAYQIQVVPTTGATFPGTVTLSLSGLPAGATYTITPSTLAADSGAQTVTIQVQTSSSVAGLRTRGTRPPIWALAMLLPMVGMLRFRQVRLSRIKRTAPLLLLLLALGILGMSACGGGGSSSGLPNQAPQTYSLQLTAASGTLQHSTNLSLTIQ